MQASLSSPGIFNKAISPFTSRINKLNKEMPRVCVTQAKFIRRTCVELNQLLLSLTQARQKCDLDSDVEFVLDVMKY